MDAWQVLTITVSLVVVVFVAGRAYNRTVEIQERAKSERSRANALERQNIKKLDGIFEMKIAQLASSANEEGDEMLNFIKTISSIPKKEGSENIATQGLSWDVLKEQLKNPEVKKLIIENQAEALKILKE